MTLQESAALFSEKSGQEMLLTLARTPDDRLEWRAEETARTVMDFLRECAVHCDEWAQLLESGVWPEQFKTRVGSIASREEAVAEMTASVGRLAAVIRGLPDDRLDLLLKAPWEEAPIGFWVTYAAGHTQYHTGQMNYIQTLYGDMGMDF
jgi:hypothetical protein